MEYMYLHYCTCVVGMCASAVYIHCTYRLHLCICAHTNTITSKSAWVVFSGFCLRILLSLESFCAVSLTTSFTAFSDDWSAFPEAFPEVSDVMRKCTSPSIFVCIQFNGTYYCVHMCTLCMDMCTLRACTCYVHMSTLYNGHMQFSVSVHPSIIIDNETIYCNAY